MKHYMKKNKLNNILFCLAIWSLLFIMLYKSPIRLDDWTWGGDIGKKRLAELFAGYNGRYNGNFSVLFLTRIPSFLRAGIMTLVIIAAYTIPRKMLQKGYFAFLIVSCFIPLSVFTQTHTWTSGFSNYFIPILSMLVVFQLCVALAEKKSVSNNHLVAGCICIVLGSTFLETITIWQICILGLMVVLSKRKDAVILFASSVIGAGVMFMNSSYKASLFHDKSNYKQINLIGDPRKVINGIIHTFSKDISPYWITHNGILNIVIILVLLFTCWKMGKRITFILLDIYLAYFLFNIVDQTWMEVITGGLLINALVNIGYILLLTYCVYSFFNGNSKMLLLLLSECILVIPLVTVSTIPLRLFFPTYFLWCMLFGEIVDSVLKDRGLVDNADVQRITARVFVVCFLVFNLISQVRSWKVYELREKAINECKMTNGDHLYIPEVPWSKYYCYGANVSNNDDYWLENYKDYYEIPRTVVVEFVEYNKYMNMISKDQ